MSNSVVRYRRPSMVRRGRVARPAVECLEDRLLMYAYTGDHFAYGSRITWSIMPDGTNLGGVTSNLVATLNARLGAGVWEQALSDAFAQWENYGNVNLVQVSDDGEAFDAGADQQGNPNFGDIRIGGFAQASNVLAFSMLPPAANGGSDSGDIFFNTSQQWNIGSTFDFETVAIHEAGHAVAGLGESTDVNSAEYEYYTGIKQGLDQDDVNGIQAAWGPRAEDGVTVAYNNLTSAQAADVTPFIAPSTNQYYSPYLDVASAAQSYWFKVTTPSNANNYLWVEVQSTNLSELSPKVQIYNSAMQGLTQVAASVTSYGATIYASVPNVTPGQTYYIKVSGSSALDTGTGAYGLGVDVGPYAMVQFSPPNTTVADQPDQGGGGLYEKTASVPMSDVFSPSPTKEPLAAPARTSNVNPSGASLSQDAYPLGTPSPATMPTPAPSQINVPHPTLSYARKLLVPQDIKIKDGLM